MRPRRYRLASPPHWSRTMPKILGIAALAVLLCGCSVQLRTAPAPVGVCDDALTSGRLVTSAQSGLALVDPTGHVTEVLWPSGYSARRGVSGIELVDEKSVVVAREGDF